jgi:NDP-sugar pyrophosphorylase family protein
MKVVVPMAGRGTRFMQQGIGMPKPLIPVAGRPMVAWALQSLSHIAFSQVIFIALAEHEAVYRITGLLRNLVSSEAEVILLNAVTEGQLCTVLAAQEFLNTDEDLLIASSDTYVVSELGQDIAHRFPACRGLISVAHMPGDCWSFARTDSSGQVVEVAEKIRISNYASTGLYYFANGREFISVAAEMIRRGEKTQGEYYVIPVYQEYIQRGWHVGLSVASEMWDMGTPEALAQFERQLAAISSTSSTPL